MEETVNITSTLTCYSCGKKGFIKSNCPDCRKQNSKNNNVITTARIAEFYTEQYNSDSRFQPLVSVEMLGQTSVACIDTGARGSLAGEKLRKLCKREEVPYHKQRLTIRLADGIDREVQALIFEVEVKILNKVIPLSLVSIPEHKQNRTLLGLDFIELANIVLNLPNGQWYFSVTPQYTYLFEDNVEEEVSAEEIDIFSAEIRN